MSHQNITKKKEIVSPQTGKKKDKVSDSKMKQKCAVLRDVWSTVKTSVNAHIHTHTDNGMQM